VRDELLASNPAARVKRQLCHRALPQHCRGRSCATAAPARRHGVRRGEALALRWSDVDLTDGLLRVRGTLLRVNGHLVISESPSRSAHAV